jgi:hypothetical protein
MTTDQAKPVIGSPLSYAWQEGKLGLEPILFVGHMSSDFISLTVTISSMNTEVISETDCYHTVKNILTVIVLNSFSTS